MYTAALWYTACHKVGGHIYNRPSVGGATVGTCVYKTANIKGHTLHVALLSQVILTATGTDN